MADDITIQGGLRVDRLAITLPDGRTITISRHGAITVEQDGNRYHFELPTLDEVATQCLATDNHATFPVWHRH